MSKICKKGYMEMRKRIYLVPLKSVLGHSILHYFGIVLNNCKVPKYYKYSCLKNLFLVSTFRMMIQNPAKSAYLDLKSWLYQKRIKNYTGSFLRSNSDLQEIRKIVLTQNHLIRNLSTTNFLYIFTKVWKKRFEIM